MNLFPATNTARLAFMRIVKLLCVFLFLAQHFVQLHVKILAFVEEQIRLE